MRVKEENNFCYRLDRGGCFSRLQGRSLCCTSLPLLCSAPLFPLAPVRFNPAATRRDRWADCWENHSTSHWCFSGLIPEDRRCRQPQRVTRIPTAAPPRTSPLQQVVSASCSPDRAREIRGTRRRWRHDRRVKHIKPLAVKNHTFFSITKEKVS